MDGRIKKIHRCNIRVYVVSIFAVHTLVPMYAAKWSGDKSADIEENLRYLEVVDGHTKQSKIGLVYIQVN